jgi:predicted component of type VI protein secretion system
LAHGELSLAGCASPDLLETPGSWSLGDPELAALAEQVRKHPAAKWVGLAAPRFLLRHPYGKRCDPIETFPFEELPAEPEAERFLWGNPAFVCAWILAQAHSRGGARWPLRQVSHVPDLPMPVYTAHGGDAIQTPLEFSLSEAAQVVMAQRGLIAFVGGRNANRISTDSLHALAAS